MATYANYLTYQILAEAGVPPGVIQFVPGPPPEVVAQAINSPDFAGLHFTGSTFVFKKLWKDIAANLDKYKGYPRIVGETGQRLRDIHRGSMLTDIHIHRWQELPSDPSERGDQERCQPERPCCVRVPG